MVRSECFPSKYPHTEWSYYSPGVCPSGWVLNSAPSIQQRFAPSTSSGETVGICCPSRYTYVDGPVGCTSYMAQSTSGSVLNPSYFMQLGDGMPYTVLQTLTASDATVTITVDISSTITASAMFLSSPVSPFFSTSVSIVSIITTHSEIYTTIYTPDVCCDPSAVPTTLINPNTTTATITSEIIYSEISASPIYTTSNIPSGEVFASGIQIRWTGNYPPTPPNPSPGLTPAQKAGISLGIIASLTILGCIVIWAFRRHRAKKRRFYASQDPVGEIGFVEAEKKGELQATTIINKHSLPHPARMEEIQERSDGFAESGRNINLGGLVQQPSVTPTTNSSMAELGSITSIKRRPIQPIIMQSTALQSATELQFSLPVPPMELDTTAVSPTGPKNPLPPTVLVSEIQPSRTEGQPEQASIAALSSTGEGSTSSRRETISEVGEEEGLRAELARVMERKQRVREMQRLKEEEENLERMEVELLAKLKARSGNANS
jgi:hypothetical protein